MEDRHIFHQVGDATFIGMFDGHGGVQAAEYAQQHLEANIAEQSGFSSEDDNNVLEAFKKGFDTTQRAMWKEQGKSIFSELQQLV